LRSPQQRAKAGLVAPSEEEGRTEKGLPTDEGYNGLLIDLWKYDFLPCNPTH
jgi:hypothetical protein